MIENSDLLTKESFDDAIIENINCLDNSLKGLNNKFVGDYKGICVRSWNTGELYSKRYREDFIEIAKKTNINAVSLIINSYQNGIEGNDPFKRTPISNEELENYILFLQENKMRIMFKPHVEIDSDNYIWRALIDPLNPDVWFEKYTSKMIEYAKICEKLNVESFCVGTEYSILTKKYPDKWIDLIKNIRSVYRGFITYGANLNNDDRDEVNSITFWDCLDYIGIDFYIYPINGGTQEQYEKGFYHTKNHKNAIALIDVLSKKHNKNIVLCEYGADGSLQTNYKVNYIKALFSTVLSRPYINGSFLWTYDPTPSSWFEKEQEVIEAFSLCTSIKTQYLDGWFSTQKGVSSNCYSKFLEYKILSDDIDSYCELKMFVKGDTYNTSQLGCNLKIKVTKTSGNSAKVFCEIDGNFNNSQIMYDISNDKIEFYVKVPNYCYVNYRLMEGSDNGLFDLFEYQKFITPTDKMSEATNKYCISKNTQKTILKVGSFFIATGVITGTMENGLILYDIELPEINQVLGINVNVSYLNGGNPYDVICSGRYMGYNKVRFTGKHLNINGSYSYELNYTIIYL